jgi:hypothetical protein
MKDYAEYLSFSRDSNLERRELADARDEFPVLQMSSTYEPAEHRVRDTIGSGPRVLTFANILKYDIFPLPAVLQELLDIGRQGMGCPVEIEFSVDLYEDGRPGRFYFLQIRPMATSAAHLQVRIEQAERERAFCSSGHGLGHADRTDIADIVYVKPEDFDPAVTREIAGEIGRLNAQFVKQQRPYLLIGFGRWGSADPWLGIPVQWQDIAGVSAMVEVQNDQLRADPSQGSHFFHNITSMEIPYVTVMEDRDRIDWQWLASRPVQQETAYLRHIQLDRPFTLKVDGVKTGQCVMLPPE